MLPILPNMRTDHKELVLADRAAKWRALKTLVLDSVSSPITRRVYNLGLDEFFACFGKEPRAGFNKAMASAWRCDLEARGLGSISINVRITAVRWQWRPPITACWRRNWPPESRVFKGVKMKGVRLGNWLSAQQAQELLNAPNATTKKGLRDRAILAVLSGLRPSTIRSGRAYDPAHPTAGWPLVHRGSRGQARPNSDSARADMGEGGDRRVDRGRRDH